MEETGYTIVDWLSAGLAVCMIFLSFAVYLYAKARLEIKDLKKKNDAFHELTTKNDDLLKDYAKLKEGHTIHEVRIIGAKPIGVSTKLLIPDYVQSEELIAEMKIELAHKIGIYCLQNDYIRFEENYDPVRLMKTLSAYLSVASNNEEIVKVLKSDPILAIDMDKVRELSAGFNCYRRANDE